MDINKDFWNIISMSHTEQYLFSSKTKNQNFYGSRASWQTVLFLWAQKYFL